VAEVVVCTTIIRQEAHCVVPYDMFRVLGDESYTRGHISRGAWGGVLWIGKRDPVPRTVDHNDSIVRRNSYIVIVNPKV
jgi:hypothetical protein